jgi:hypothetical protein
MPLKRKVGSMMNLIPLDLRSATKACQSYDKHTVKKQRWRDRRAVRSTRCKQM